MGRQRRPRAHHQRRDVRRAMRTRVRGRDLDQIQGSDLARREELEHQEIDESLPGLGQHYCVECAKYFESGAALITHGRSKVHKRRLRQLADPAYTPEEADRAAGLGVDNRQRGVEELVVRQPAAAAAGGEEVAMEA